MANAIYGSMIELQYLNFLFSKNNFQSVVLNGIGEEHFTTYKEQFLFIRDFYNKYSQLPSKETFQGKFADRFEWLLVSDPEEYLVEKLREAKLYRDIIKHYKDLGELIKEEKTDKAVEKMAEISQKFLKSKQEKCVDLIADASIRYDSYMERVKNPAKYFVTTGLKELDDILGGWDMENETALVCARTGVGKSWIMVYFALAAAKAGLRVGFYSGEMELDLVGYRMDTFLGNISNGSLTHGNENVMEQYQDYLSKLNKNVTGHIYCATPDTFDGTPTVSKVRAFIEKYDIQFMCIDQFSLLNDEKHARNPREQAVNISKDLRALQRLKKIPFIIAVQLNREESDDGPTTKNIAESDRIGQDCTTSLFIEKKGENMVLTVGKSRNAKTGDKLTYMWSINRGILHYIPTENDGRGGSGSELLEDVYGDKSDSVF